MKRATRDWFRALKDLWFELVFLDPVFSVQRHYLPAACQEPLTYQDQGNDAENSQAYQFNGQWLLY